MKKSCNWIGSFFFALVLCCSFVSCMEDPNKYYETPDWLKGSIYEVLEGEGNYSIFLKGVELANMKPMVDGKNILTVMAPSDSAFTVYLKEYYGGKKIEELPVDEISKLIGFHILYYSFTKDMLINFRPLEGDGATEAERNRNAGLFYKFRTKSSDAITVETVETDTSRMDYNVYHLERFLPVFSYRMFQTKQVDAQYNYEYFFPDTPWRGAGGFNISNASVDEYAVIADNGYIYKIDRVLRPLETIYNELAYNGDYSDFLQLYDAYQYYQLDEILTREYGNGTDLYQHYHSSLPSIACEWPITDYRLVSILAYTSYSVFAPNNAALRGFFDDYWRVGGYNSLEEVSPTSVQYLLFNCVYDASIVFPEEIKKGLIENSFGTVIKFDVDAVPKENRKICVNGVLYGCDVLTPPAMFGSVTGPAYQHKKFSYFLDMISNSELVMTLASDETRYFMLYPSDDLMNRIGITRGEDGSLLNGMLQRLSARIQQDYVYSHVVSLDGTTGSYQSLPASGAHVFRTLSPTMNLYWYVNDGKITNCIKHNELLYDSNLKEEDVYSELTELIFRDGWTNGKCYAYDNTVPYVLEGSNENAIYAKFVPMMIGNRNQTSTLYHGFIKLLEMADLLEMESQSIIPVVESSLMFIPTTMAVKEGILGGKIPGITSGAALDDPDFFSKCDVAEDISDLQYYLLQYFIPLSTAVISNFPYVGWEETTPGGLPTLQTYFIDLGGGRVEIRNTRMNVRDAGNKISIQVLDYDATPLTGVWIDAIEEYHYFPFVFDDGCVHFIKEVI